MKYRQHQPIEEVKSAVKRFRERQPFPFGYGDKIYEQLEKWFLIDISKSILARWLPDSDGSSSLALVDQDGNICYIEMSAETQAESEIDFLPINEFAKTNDYKQIKPWDPLKIAIDIFESESS